MTRKKQGGFTLIKLMIVVVILGIITVLVLPRFMGEEKRFMQREALLTLKQIMLTECVLKGRDGNFSLVDSTLRGGETIHYAGGITIVIPDESPYEYHIVETPLGGLLVTATANLDDDPTIDTWTIDQQGKLLCLINDLT